MTNKKKTYLTPEMKVVEIDQADIIAASGPLNYNEGVGFEEYDEIIL